MGISYIQINFLKPIPSCYMHVQHIFTGDCSQHTYAEGYPQAYTAILLYFLFRKKKCYQPH